VTVLAVGLISCIFIGRYLYWFFGTEIGCAIRATGFNQQMIRAQGVNTNITIVLGLLISNMLVGIAGALVAQNNGFADVGMGVGTIVIGLGQRYYRRSAFRNPQF
jgi:putative ABC transport system permease protein